jgi:arylsulfatase A-like enzyme
MQTTRHLERAAARPTRGIERPSWIALLVMWLVLLVLASVAQAAAPPNIVFILADDLDWRSTRYMPELQALGRQGATFEGAYMTTPICVPSRATILTGQYPQNSGVRSNRPPTGGYRAFHQRGLEDETVAVWLKRAGYRTAMIGKYFNYYPDPAPPMHVPEGWTYWAVPENHADMHAKYEYTLNVNGTRVTYGNAKRDYSTDVFAARARAFIADSAARERPFAVFLWFPSPHVKEVPAPRHEDLFPRLRAPRLASFPELDLSDKPSFMRVPPLSPTQVAEIDERYRNRVRMLQSVDEALASIRDLLQAQGLLENTYIVFTSDNGWHQGEHNQMPSKGRPHEEDIRVSLVVSGPGVPAGRTISRLVGNADFAPTFADWAGVRPDPKVDGRSFAQLVSAPDPMRIPWRNRLPIMRAIEGVALTRDWPSLDRRSVPTPDYGCLEHLTGTEQALPEWRGVRTERYTYVEYATGDLELYDNGSDPRQIRNAICRATTSLVRHLHQTTEALFTCRADACRRAENW